MVNRIDPSLHGIYCINGKSALPVGADVKTEANWEVYLKSNPETDDVLLDDEAWVAVGFDTSAPHKTRGTIYAEVNGESYQCYRTLTVIEKDESEGIAPSITTDSIPNGYTGHLYSEQLEASGTMPITWKAQTAMPPSLTLSETGKVEGYVNSAGTYAFAVRARNVYGAATKMLFLRVFDEYTLEVASASGQQIILPLGTPITGDMLVVKHLGKTIQMGSTGYTLKYDPYLIGEQPVKAIYDPHLEEISRLAKGSITVKYTEDDQSR